MRKVRRDRHICCYVAHCQRIRAARYRSRPVYKVIVRIGIGRYRAGASAIINRLRCSTRQCTVAVGQERHGIGLDSGRAVVASVPPYWPRQLHVHGPLPLTADAVPAEHRFVDGAVVNVPPLELPQDPFTASCAKFAVIVISAVTLLTVSGFVLLVTDPVQFTK